MCACDTGYSGNGVTCPGKQAFAIIHNDFFCSFFDVFLVFNLTKDRTFLAKKQVVPYHGKDFETSYLALYMIQRPSLILPRIHNLTIVL